MTIETIVAIILSGALLLFLIGLTAKKAPRGLNKEYYQKHWVELLSNVKTPEGMALAIIDADKLVDIALKKRNFKGKTMGERLVSAQRQFSDNDGLWQSHKLRNRLVHEPGVRLKDYEAKKALASFRQALRDLGAL
jgi:hypothetical protein